MEEGLKHKVLLKRISVVTNLVVTPELSSAKKEVFLKRQTYQHLVLINVLCVSVS